MLVLLAALAALLRYLIGPAFGRFYATIWVTLGLVIAFAAGGLITARVDRSGLRDSITDGLIVAAYGLAILTLLIVLAVELYLDPITDFRSVQIALGLHDPAGTPPWDFYGDPSIQPPEIVYDRVIVATSFCVLVVAMLALASILGGVAGSTPTATDAALGTSEQT